MSLRELNELWVDDVDISGGNEIISRTFNNHVRAIWDLFHIEIECDRRNDYKYKIVSDTVNPIASHMMSNFEQNMALRNATELDSRIIAETAPCGAEYLETIRKAMENSRRITIVFKDFNAEESFTVTGDPYCLKLYQQRWYVVLREDDGVMDSYSLDRITHIKVEKNKFKMDSGFDAEEYFRYSFGVRVNHEAVPSLIKLKVRAVQRGYFRTLPLHPSQKEVETCEDYSIFTLELVPTVELTMKLLSYGFLVEVLEPDYLRDVIKEEAEALYNTYFIL